MEKIARLPGGEQRCVKSWHLCRTKLPRKEKTCPKRTAKRKAKRKVQKKASRTSDLLFLVEKMQPAVGTVLDGVAPQEKRKILCFSGARRKGESPKRGDPHVARELFYKPHAGPRFIVDLSSFRQRNREKSSAPGCGSGRNPVLPFLDFYVLARKNPQINQGFLSPAEPTKTLEKAEKNTF